MINKTFSILFVFYFMTSCAKDQELIENNTHVPSAQVKDSIPEDSITKEIPLPEPETIPEPEPEEPAMVYKDTLKILAIGNSFSEDALEHHLVEIAEADQYYFVVGNLYYPGAPLDFHWNNCSTNSAQYRYYRSDVYPTKGHINPSTIQFALKDQDWDYVSLQQASNLSGMSTTFSPYLEQIINYVHQEVNTPTQIILHQTWAYAPQSTHAGFANYNNDQMQMFQQIVAAYVQWETIPSVALRIPSGTAIQNARTTPLGTDLTRDGYHLDLRVGRYIAALTWYEKLTGRSVIGNTYRPAQVTNQEIQWIQQAVHKAVMHPNDITPIQ
jgi:hypothetical protein